MAHYGVRQLIAEHGIEIAAHGLYHSQRDVPRTFAHGEYLTKDYAACLESVQRSRALFEHGG